MKSNSELAKVFLQKNVDTTRPTVHMCQKGIFTCVADLAQTILGGQKTQFYDASWAEFVS